MRLRRSRGASGLTYGLLLGVVAVGALTAVSQVGDAVTALFGQLSLHTDAPLNACSPANDPEPGTVCGDGTIFLGTLTYSESDGGPSGRQQLFTTPCHLGQGGGAGNCGGTPTMLPWADGQTYSNTDPVCPSGTRVEPRAQCPRNWNWVDVEAVPNVGFGDTSDRGGWANTEALVTTDSNAVEPGRQPHRAAAACANLTANGHSDWYLPGTAEIAALQAASDEPSLQSGIFDQYQQSGNSCVRIGEGYACQIHTSTESNVGSNPSNSVAWFTVSDLIVQGSKSNLRAVRCMRRG